MPFISLVAERADPATDHRVARVALKRRAHLANLAEQGSVGLSQSIRGHEQVLELIANRYGHDSPYDPSLLEAIPVTID